MLNKKNKAIFLDRDGTIIRQVDELIQGEQLLLLPKAADAIKRFNQLGYLCVVVTNQPIIQKGLITLKEAEQLNELLIKKLSQIGAHIDAVYMSPHSYPSTCSCRKPAIGMIRRAQKKFNIDLNKSFMIGDSTRDVATGVNAGTKTILVKTGDYGHGGRDSKFFDTKADYVVRNLLGAVRIIIDISKASRTK